MIHLIGMRMQLQSRDPYRRFAYVFEPWLRPPGWPWYTTAVNWWRKRSWGVDPPRLSSGTDLGGMVSHVIRQMFRESAGRLSSHSSFILDYLRYYLKNMFINITSDIIWRDDYQQLKPGCCNSFPHRLTYEKVSAWSPGRYGISDTVILRSLSCGKPGKKPWVVEDSGLVWCWCPPVIGAYMYLPQYNHRRNRLKHHDWNMRISAGAVKRFWPGRGLFGNGAKNPAGRDFEHIPRGGSLEWMVFPIFSNPVRMASTTKAPLESWRIQAGSKNVLSALSRESRFHDGWRMCAECVTLKHVHWSLEQDLRVPAPCDGI